MMTFSRAGLISKLGMALGLAIILTALAKTAHNRNDHYLPLLFFGLVVGIVSTPFYYYYKAADKNRDDFADAGLKALSAAGKNLAKERQQQRARTKNNNT